MAVHPQNEAADHHETHAAIGRKGLWINESRSNKTNARKWPYNPKNEFWREDKGKKTISGVGETEYGNGFQQEIRSRWISAQLQGKPEHAGSRDKPQKPQACEIAI